MISCTHCREDISEGYCEECYNEAYESLMQRQEGKVLVDKEDLDYIFMVRDFYVDPSTKEYKELEKIKNKIKKG